MKLLIHTQARTIHEASNLGGWQVPPGFEILDVPGDADTFSWPNGGPTRCVVDSGNSILPNPSWNPSLTPLMKALDTLLALPTPNIQQIIALLRVWRQGM